MRPPILFPLFADVRTLDGVGPKLGQLIGKAAGTRVIDLIFHLPAGLIDRSYAPKLAEAAEGRIATVLVNVLDHVPRRDSRHPYRVRCSDETSVLELVFFHGRHEYLARMLPAGTKRLVSGRIDRFGTRLQMVHPDYILSPEEADRLPLFEPVYRLTEGLSAKTMLNAIEAARRRLPELPEWQNTGFFAARRWQAFGDAVRLAHAPKSTEGLEPSAAPRARLAYDELLANQLALALIRKRQRSRKGRALAGTGELGARARKALPFELTPAQEQALAEILRDMGAPNRMSRLLQGDVGAGKTIVAMLAMLNGVEAGAQAALMAPTEILARQHFAALAPLADAAGVRMHILTGRERGSAREQILAELVKGRIDIIVGTHALFSEGVEFRDLGLAVVDEQHRFGVHQRLKLQGKGDARVDVLVMTATPIPRTLALTAYGDMDVSRITGLPPGRKPVETRLVSAERVDEVIERLRRALARGQRAFWVCPLVEESEKLDLSAAEERARTLGEGLGLEVGLAHGRMKPAERDRAMERFRSGETRVLVATTVIEVGVDVPEATIMVIEHAERFGLAQLHQLRGRVGRGTGRSTCILLYQPPLGEVATARLSTIRDTNDGFVIAEEDLRLRGAGELLGTTQSGVPLFRVADLAAHADLLSAARDDARMIVENDPELASPRGEALRVLLYLFEREEAVRYLLAG
ncbi:MAG TPA: ATP-dependent DNA helicase RecG [Rhizomicrobium sp.]|jgi:ATP-dependent DNA helicase RecG|nr:ATP-dependent DNA helicase RecG [Rhizomicrobium sp.]